MLRQPLSYLRPSTVSFLFGLTACILVVLVFLLTYWNRFVGLCASCNVSQYFAGMGALDNYLPYRDYYAPGPFLPVFKVCSSIYLFGPTLLGLRFLSLIYRLALVAIIYCWLKRLFKSSTATLATMVTMVLGSACVFDTIDFYHLDAVLFATAAGFISSFIITRSTNVKQTFLLSLGTGVCCALSILTKQSVGGGITLSIPAIVLAILLRQQAKGKFLGFFSGYVLGWLLPVLLGALWLLKNGLLNDFLYQVFIEGPSAKASSIGFFGRYILIVSQFPLQVFLAMVLLALAFVALFRSFKELPKSGENENKMFGIYALSGLVCVSLGWAIAQTAPGWVMDKVVGILQIITCVTFEILVCIGTSAFCFLFLARWLKRDLPDREAQFALYSAVSFTVCFTIALSFPLFEVMFVPALGLFLGLLLDNARPKAHLMLVLYCFSTIITSTLRKQDKPYYFDEFREPRASIADIPSKLAELQGLVLPKETVNCVEEVTRLVLENSSPSDKLYIYPEMDVFFVLTKRRPSTSSFLTMMDVLTEQRANMQVNELTNSPPKILIFARNTEASLGSQEKYYKGGRTANRDIIAACESLAKSYRLLGRFTIGKCPPISVYVRQDSQDSTEKH